MQAIRQLACISFMAFMAVGCASDDSDDSGANQAGSAGAETERSTGGASSQAGSGTNAGAAGDESEEASGGTSGDAGDESAGTGGDVEAAGTGGTEETAGTGGTEETAGTGGTEETAGTGGTEEAAGTGGTAGTVEAAGSAGTTAGTAGTVEAGGMAGAMTAGGSAGSAETAGTAGVPDLMGGETESASSEFAQIEGAEFTDGDAPEASGDASAPDLIAPETVINGGTATYTVEVPEGAESILVQVTGDSGYYTIPVTSTSGTQTFDLTLLQNFEEDSVEVNVATVDGDGEVSTWTKKPIAVVVTQGGAIKVSLSFDANEDLDLAVMDPTGDLVYFNNPESSTGGTLDLDSNSGCSIDGVNNENIYWAEDDAPSGEYTVYVSWYAQCSAATTEVNATITATVGEDVYTGSLVLTPDMACDPEEGCSMSDLIAVGTFTY